MAGGYNLVPHTYNAYDLASLYLRRAGLPDTKLNRRMLAAWFMAESYRSGNSVRVYNNNPLNITTRDPNVAYHQFSGNGLHFVNYATPEAGADAWASLVRRRYPRIWTVFQKQSGGPALAAAITASPWGTSGALVGRIFAGLSGDATGNPLGGSDGSGAPSSDNKQALAEIGAFYYNGKPLVSYPEGHILTRKDVDVIMGAIDKSGWIQSQGTNPVAEALALDTIRNILISHVGEPWNKKLVAKIATETGFAAVSAGANPIATAFQLPPELATWVDPAAWVGRFVRAGAVVTGAVLIFFGLKIIIGDVGLVSAGGTKVENYIEDDDDSGDDDGGDEPEVIETRYPVIVKDSASPRAPRGTSARFLAKQRKQADREWLETNQPEPTPMSTGGTFAPQRKEA